MGTSHPETKPWAVAKIKSLGPVRVLDVGAGSGTWADWLKRSNFRGTIDALEIWKPYIDQFNLHRKYANVFEADVREWTDFKYDVVIFGDILEHMSKADALKVMHKVSQQARYVLIAIPIVHYHQGELNGNPYEAHVKDDWSHEEMLATFPEITEFATYSITGAYWLCYNF